MASDFLTFAADPAANVMTQAQYAAGTFTPRLLGFSTGTAVSLQLNKAWRQSSIIAATIGTFIDTQTGLGAVDDGTPSGMTALLTNFTTAVSNVARGAIGTGYLPLTGGTLTGNLTINAPLLTQNALAGGNATHSMTRPVGHVAQILAANSASQTRWLVMLADATAESGSNTGSNFSINRYDDGGNFLSSPLSISRSTGVVNFGVTPTVAGAPMNFLPISGGTLTGALAIIGNGVRYQSFSGNYHAFGWDGTNSIVNMYVDGSYVGGIATRAYVGSVAGNYLPLTGGTVSGNVALNAFTWFNQGGFSSSVYFGNSGDFSNFTDGRYRYRQWAGSWYDYWDGQSGTRGWTAASGRYMSLDGNANWSVSGTATVIGGRIVAQGNGFSPSITAWNIQGGTAMGFWVDPSYMWFGNMDGAGNPSAGLMFLRNDGYLQVYNSIYSSSRITAAGDMVAGGWVYASNGGGSVLSNQGVVYANNSANHIGFLYDYGNTMFMTYINGSPLEIIKGDSGNRVRYLGMSGSTMHWTDSDGSGWFANTFRSDVRYKRNVRDAGDFDSLAAICATPTRAFDWREDYNVPPVPYGFISSDVRETLPDAVMAAPSEEGQEPVDHLDPMALFAHVFRAIGQLDGKIETLREEAGYA